MINKTSRSVGYSGAVRLRINVDCCAEEKFLMHVEIDLNDSPVGSFDTNDSVYIEIFAWEPGDLSIETSILMVQGATDKSSTLTLPTVDVGELENTGWFRCFQGIKQLTGDDLILRPREYGKPDEEPWMQVEEPWTQSSARTPSVDGRFIPITLDIDHCPLEGADGADGAWIGDEPVPGVFEG